MTQKKYRVCFPWYCTVSVDVEAETKEEAKEKAIKEVHPHLCWQCSDNIEMGESNDDLEPDVYED